MVQARAMMRRSWGSLAFAEWERVPARAGVSARSTDTTMGCVAAAASSVVMGNAAHIRIHAPRKKRKPPRGNATGAIIGGIIGVVIFLCLIGALIFLLRKRQLNAENDDAPPKHKPPPPVKMGSSTEMLNKPHNPSTETQPLSHIYYETGGEPVTDLDDEGQDGAPANGSGPALWDSSATHMPAENHATADDSYPEAPEPPLPNSGATVARGESFMSEPMLV
ncbi:uncharacterized protein LOC125285688 [Alosa alosa]|uniref:uncharacterized protein LOC125285688 n=1 Tax=Alosa alosa TaxID=278164 RepID=UPI0020154D61|nr:uncharacterized protein LOC125285688 [Alosa alosa]